jgi:hypothetical protein
MTILRLSPAQTMLVAQSKIPVWTSAGTEPLLELTPWDTVYLADRRLPGLCRIAGKGVEHEIDIKKNPGEDGARFTDLGRTIARVTITVVLTWQTDWDLFETFVPALQALGKTGKLLPLSVRNPQLNILGIKSLYVTCVSIPEPGSVRGTFEVKLDCLEYREPKKSVGSGTPDKDVNNWRDKGNGYAPQANSAPYYLALPSKTETEP